MALAITVNGAGTFTASMEEGPVSFTASLGAVPGPKGDTGATGPAGVVAATAPIVYTSGTQTVSMDTSYFLRSPAVAGTDGQIVSWDTATSRPLWIDNQARTLFATVRNETGSTLTKGTVVYINGASGNKATVTKAQANSDATSAQTFAVIYADISNNQNGTAIVAGELAGLNTSSYADGAALYLSPTTAGAFTTTKPSAPDHLVYVATVTRSHATQGTIEVRIQNGYELEELHNVAISGVANKDILAYDSATSLWKNRTFSALDLLTITSAASTYQTQAGMSSYAPLASPTFTGDPKAPTPATSDNDTSIATTAFVNSYCPTASTSTAGKVQLATDAEARTKTDISKAVTPSNLVQLNLGIGRMPYIIQSFSAATSGTGGLNDTLALSRRTTGPTSTGAGYVSASQGMVPNRGQAQSLNIDWTKRIRVFARLQRDAASPSNNSIYRFTLGEPGSSYTGDPTVRSIGIKITGTGVINALAHDGTTLTTIATTYTPTYSSAFDLVMESDGAGNITWSADGTQIASTALGPKTYLGGANSQNILYTKVENTSSFTSAAQAYLCYIPCGEYLP